MIRIEDCETPFGAITIFRAKATGAFIYNQGGCCQSEADSTGVSLASYIHAIFGLTVQARAQKILLIGCGGGTLGTMLARRGRAVTIVDVNPAAFPLARQYFELPDSVDCRVADGREFLLSDNRVYDAIVLDAYQGDRIPAHLRSLEFFRLARSRLTQSGALFANIHVVNDIDSAPDRIADCMANVWTDTRLLDAPGWGNRNAIVMAGNVSHLKEPVLLERPGISANEIEAELATMKFRARRSFIRLRD
jgi:spermidine synthase